MVTTRRGAGSFGCLISLLLVAVVGYVGFRIGDAYLGYLRYKDAMAQQVRFADRYSDSVIRLHLTAIADSLGLPPDARVLTLEREGDTIRISARYTETMDFRVTKKELHFNPRAQGTF